jgi:hypothetical protein
MQSMKFPIKLIQNKLNQIKVFLNNTKSNKSKI